MHNKHWQIIFLIPTKVFFHDIFKIFKCVMIIYIYIYIILFTWYDLLVLIMLLLTIFSNVLKLIFLL